MELCFMLALLTSYICGSLPSGFLLTLYFEKIDIRTIGSCNIGATNVLRSGNKKIAFLTLILDMSKGALPLLFFKIFYNLTILQLSLCAFFSVLGQIFPIWLRFKGGKGVATSLGNLCALFPTLGIIGLVSWGICFKLFKISSLAAICSFFCVAITSLIFCIYGKEFFPCVFFCFSLFFLSLWTHRDNIKRLKEGSESKV